MAKVWGRGMYESVSLSRRRNQGTGGMSKGSNTVVESRGRRSNNRTQNIRSAVTDLFYRGAVHCVMLDEKEQRISSRGAFGFVWGGGGGLDE